VQTEGASRHRGFATAKTIAVTNLMKTARATRGRAPQISSAAPPDAVSQRNGCAMANLIAKITTTNRRNASQKGSTRVNHRTSAAQIKSIFNLKSQNVLNRW
jgi:hypothetical protein